MLLPRGSSFNIWELSPNKLKTAAVAFTFVVTAGYISMLAAGGECSALAVHVWPCLFPAAGVVTQAVWGAVQRGLVSKLKSAGEGGLA